MRKEIGSRVVRWLVVAAMCALPVQGFASQVNTSDIVNGAVTTPKIADGAVTAAKIAPGVLVKPAKLVVVATSGGDFNNPITAVNSITNASTSNPYLIKVMPGVYDLGAASLQMKPYVHLEGSGDASVITSAIVDNDGHCINGTLNMSDNSTVKNVRIENTGTGNNGVTAGVVFYNVTSELESSSVYVGTSTNNSNKLTSVCAEGSLANATLNNVKLSAVAGVDGNPASLGITLGANARVTNSRLNAENTGGSHLHVINCHNFASGVDDSESNGTLMMTNSYVEGKTSDWNALVYGNACKYVNISNSIIVARDSSGTNAIETNRDLEIINTQIYSEGITNPVQLLFDASLNNHLKVATSKLEVTVPYLTNVKLFSNFDRDFNPIPNQ